MKDYKNESLLFLRIVIAAIFIYSAFGKVSYLNAGLVTGSMVYLLWFLVFVEPIAALGVLLGYKTKITSMALAVIMVGAVLMLKFTMGTALFTGPTGPGLDYNFLILAGSLIIFTFGAGKYSMGK